MRRRRPNPQRRSAAARYHWHRRSGLDPDAARLAVAIEWGLATTLVRLTGTGEPKTSPMTWTIPQMDALEFLRWCRLMGKLGGPEG